MLSRGKMVFLQPPPVQIELELSVDFARLLAHLFFAISFHAVGIGLVVMSSWGSLWFRRR